VLVESTTLDAVVDAVVTVAPDLVLVVGDAARDAGNEVRAERAVLAEDSGADLSHERPARQLRRFYTPETGEEHALRRLAHVILSLPEAQLN